MPWARHFRGAKLNQMRESLSSGILQSLKQNWLLQYSSHLHVHALCLVGLYIFFFLDFTFLTLQHSNLFCIMIYSV